MSTPKDDYGRRHIIGTPGCLFVLGSVLPSLLGIWLIWTNALRNAPFYGQQTTNPTYPRDVAELWITAVILTLTTLALTAMALRYFTTRGTRMVTFITLTSIAAALNWAILLLPQ